MALWLTNGLPMLFAKKNSSPFAQDNACPDECTALQRTLKQLRAAGHRNIALAYFEHSPLQPEWKSFLSAQQLAGIIRCDGYPDQAGKPLGLKSWDLKQITKDQIDCIVVFDPARYDWALRYLEIPILKGILVVFADPDQAVPPPVRATSKMDALKSIPTEYVARSGLTGHYLEFGVWWGRSFFSNYFRMKEWLNGDFYAFDSFAGLSQPLPQETEYTGGDFRPNTYAFNLPSFEFLMRQLEIDQKRIRAVQGFYSESLKRPAADYGLQENSVSVCVVDCDLLEPTLDVLNFVAPLLQKGALLYFDDWRLCRASPEVGERAAGLQWLKENPQFELVELHRDHWQHQWFIFQKTG